MSGPRNLVNLSGVGKGYAARTILSDLTLGVSAGDRIGVVGRNGDGKSTLLRLIAGTEEPDAGGVTRSGTLALELLGQADDLDPARTIREELVGGRADHEWAGDAGFRSVLDGLLGGVALSRFPQGLDTPIAPLSGGERRRIALARTLLDNPELLLLDEPTNHLDVEGVDWLARHLAARRGTLLVVTHDRWFLDAVCTATWEVADGGVHQYEGGYAAYVLARAERERDRGRARGAPPGAAAQGAGLAAARAAGAHLQAALPDRGRRGADRRTSPSRATARSCCASRAPGSATACSTPSTSPSPTTARRCCATRPGGSGRATAWRSSASTARARPR